MSEKEFQKILNDHDWWYMMSDDPRSFDRGKESEDKIKELTNNNPTFMRMYLETSRRIYKNQ